jgi:hypothetical protein
MHFQEKRRHTFYGGLASQQKHVIFGVLKIVCGHTQHAADDGCISGRHATLEDQFPDVVVAQPALLARHCAEAGLAETAVVFWLKAGEQALARSATTEAAAQLRKGLDALDGLPDGPGRRQQELDLQLALGHALIATKGHSAPEVGESFARARVLAEQIDRPEYVWRVFLGQWTFCRNRGEYRLALALAEQVEKIGEARNDVAAQWVGRWASGYTRLFLGDFVAARALLERCHGLADPARGLLSASLHRYNARIPRHDLGVSGLHRSSTVAAVRGIVGGPPAQGRLNAS